MRRLARAMASVAATGLAFGHSPGDHDGARIEASRVPAALRAFWADGFFSAAQDAFILAYLPLLAHELGATNTQVGLLTAAQSLGALLALYPGAFVARRTRSRRWVVVFYAGILGRLTLFGAALTVAFFHGQTALWSVTLLFTVRAFLGSFVLPAWTSFAADVIPDGLRARYFASRNFAISGATLTVTPLGGLLLDRMGFPGGYVAALLVSFALGMVSTFAYSRIPEPPPRPVTANRPRVTISPREAFRNRPFRMFVLATFSLHFSTQIAGPFFNLYLKDNIGGSNFDIGWLTTASALSGLVGQLAFGDLMSRKGSLWLGRVSLLVLPLLPLMWLFVSAPWMVLAPNVIGGAMWAAFGLANFQHLLEVTDESEREDYVALFHTCVFSAMFLAPFLGGVLADTFGYRATFLVSGLGRVASTVLFFFFVPSPMGPGKGKSPDTPPAMPVTA
jgi:MFS family permease